MNTIYGLAIIGFLFFVFMVSPIAISIFTFEMRVGEYFLGLATVILGFATVFLAHVESEEGKRNRDQTRIEAEKNRRRLRLKEQLEGLYSPLVGRMDSLPNQTAHMTSGGPVFQLMASIRNTYEFLAEPELKDLFRDYYNNKLPLNSIEWKKLIDLIIDTIGVEYARLSDEYSNLTTIRTDDDR